MIVLDTHALVWWIGGNARLSRNAAKAIRKEQSSEGRIIVSAISTWEIGMLVSKGRLALAMDVDEWLQTIQGTACIALLPLTTSAATASTRLPGTFHGDPADRMIVATAREENAPLVTADQRIRRYRHIRTIW
ncbi:MAG: type II toxin-antitoxin system VapC family toxin [Rhodanobacteraceae bacterium]